MFCLMLIRLASITRTLRTDFLCSSVLGTCSSAQHLTVGRAPSVHELHPKGQGGGLPRDKPKLSERMQSKRSAGDRSCLTQNNEDRKC